MAPGIQMSEKKGAEGSKDAGKTVLVPPDKTVPATTLKNEEIRHGKQTDAKFLVRAVPRRGKK